MQFATHTTIYCPDGHHMKVDAFLLGPTGLRCRHRELRPGGVEECGRWVYAWPGAPDEGETRIPVIVVEARYAELELVMAQQIEPQDVVSWLQSTPADQNACATYRPKPAPPS